MEYFERGRLKKYGRALLNQGFSAEETARILNVTKESVYTYNKKFWRVPLAKKMSEKQKEIAWKMINNGFNYKQIANHLGFAEATIKDHNIRNWHLPYSKIQIARKQKKRKCMNCGKEFYVYESKLKHDACNYCSKKCSHLGAIKTDKIRSPIFRGYRWGYLSKEIRDEVPFCLRCGSTRKRLTVHHIRPWNLNGDNSKNNLLVLCDSCHRHVEFQTKNIMELMGIDNAIELIKLIYKYRLERIKWIYTKLNK